MEGQLVSWLISLITGGVDGNVAGALFRRGNSARLSGTRTANLSANPREAKARRFRDFAGADRAALKPIAECCLNVDSPVTKTTPAYWSASTRLRVAGVPLGFEPTATQGYSPTSWSICQPAREDRSLKQAPCAYERAGNLRESVVLSCALSC